MHSLGEELHYGRSHVVDKDRNVYNPMRQFAGSNTRSHMTLHHANGPSGIPILFSVTVVHM
jgi:hypothetical protein